jgi:hypothetical protein
MGYFSSPIPMALCRNCGRYITWKKIGEQWQSFDSEGKPHGCKPGYFLRSLAFEPRNAVCSNCWKPIVSNRNACTCLNPVYVDKRYASELKAKSIAAAKQKERALSKQAHNSLSCIICDSPAVQTGEIVMCLGETRHILSSKYYVPTIGE